MRLKKLSRDKKIREDLEMVIGVPKEIMVNENRVAATPETVQQYVSKGWTVIVERGAGEGSNFFDDEYKAKGAIIEDDVERLYEQADLILKVKEPLFNEEKNKHELDMMRKGQYLITFLHPASPSNHEMVRKMAQCGVISLTLDGIPRISRAQTMDALTSMSTCAGYKGIMMAANSLSKFVPQIFTAVGAIQPAKALVIGAGVAGLQAIATARRLGAVVYAADIRPEANEQAMSLGAKVIDLNIPSELAVGKGGYAKHLPEEWLVKEREQLAEMIRDMDIVFLSALVPNRQAPILVTEEMVKQMKPGSTIVDVSIDQGGNCAITPNGTSEVKHGVTIHGIKNIPGLIPETSTYMFAQNVFHLVNYLVKDDKIELDLDDEIVTSILVTNDNEIVHNGAREAMGI